MESKDKTIIFITVLSNCEEKINGTITEELTSEI
jgi:hypothetical protein